MITKAQAMAAQYRTECHHATMRNADGSPLRARVNGACKTWKREPERFQLPIKHGLKDCGYMTDADAYLWHGDAQSALSHGREIDAEKDALRAQQARMREAHLADIDARR